MSKTRHRRLSGKLPFKHRRCRPDEGDRQLVYQIRERAEQLDRISDRELRQRGLDLRESITSGHRKLHEAATITECFALTMQASQRTLGMQHYDVQLLGGLVMTRAATAEMRTGEGKTLTSTLPAVAAGMSGQGVHVCTVNSYLCRRDFEQLQPVFHLLGLTVGLIETHASQAAKRAAYECDITYSTGYDVGFDFLRDEDQRRASGNLPPGTTFRNRLRGLGDQENLLVQTRRPLAMIDEIDSVLIDEATTPLIISGHQGLPTDPAIYRHAQQVARQLAEDVHFLLDREKQNVQLTAEGSRLVHQQMPTPAGQLARAWKRYIEQALCADYIYQRDSSYVVRDGEVCIVDQFTGRIFEDRTWRDGLHQAIECKEGLEFTPEKRTVARISRQCFFRLYDSLCGMTGTIAGHESEFRTIYRLPIVVIPPRKPVQQVILPTQYFPTELAKWLAIASDIQRRHQTGQPVLVGTRTIAQSIAIADLLTRIGVSHQVLNGLQDEAEAELVGRSGEAGMVTIATNMAGRGTDIKISPAARNAGGLHVIAVERFESHRIDRQLAGRSGRQGEVGSCQFFVSADDELIARHAPDFAHEMGFTATAEGIAHPGFDRRIAGIQQRCERAGFLKRREMLEHELWLDDFRTDVA